MLFLFKTFNAMSIYIHSYSFDVLKITIIYKLHTFFTNGAKGNRVTS